MVDRESASASEIVSGALQDHDRGIVVGETTFGKGLVQSVYPLSENTGLALTTQKYFTPVGRSIQRPYTGEDTYYLEWRERDAVPKPKDDAPVFKTDTGRIVYGGGGITPDIPVQIPEYPELVVQLLRTSAFPRFVTALSAEDRKKFAADPASVLPPFTTFVLADMPEITADALAAAKEDILLQLRGEMALLDGGLAARERVLLEKNPVLEKALASFPEAERLMSQRRAVPETRTAEALGTPSQTR
jgi:carboxyl-terminal processing protease